MALAKMRTVKQCYEEIHHLDNNSSISEYYLRTLVKTKPNQIGAFKTGVKTLINWDLLMNYLNNQCMSEEDSSDYGVLRKVKE